jgi:hypothetical protein
MTWSTASEVHRLVPVAFWDGTATWPAATLSTIPELTDTAQPDDAGLGHNACSRRRSCEAA